MTFIVQTLNTASSTVNGVFFLCDFRVDREWLQQKQNQWGGRWVISSMAGELLVFITGQCLYNRSTHSFAHCRAFDPFHRDSRKYTGKMKDDDSTAKQQTGKLQGQKLTEQCRSNGTPNCHRQTKTTRGKDRTGSQRTEGCDVTGEFTRSVSREQARLATGDQSGGKC